MAGGWFFPHPLAWLLMLAVVVTDTAWLALSDMKLASLAGHVSWDGFTGTLLLLAILTGVAAIHGRRMIAAVIFAFAFYLVFSKAGVLLSYLGVSMGLPLADPALARIDAALGFDWLAYVSAVNDTPWLSHALGAAYRSYGLGLGATVLYLVAAGRLERLRAFFILFAMTGVVTTLAGGVLPATSGYHFHHPAAAMISNLPKDAGRDFVPDVLALHAGAMTTLDLGSLKGIVAIPSFHTIMALMVLWALRGTWAFPAGVIFCVLTIAATPVFGGHFLTDLIAGFLVFAVAVILLSRAGLAADSENPGAAGPAEHGAAAPAE